MAISGGIRKNFIAAVYFPIGAYLALLVFYVIEIYLLHNWESTRYTNNEFFRRVVLFGVGQFGTSLVAAALFIRLFRKPLKRATLRDILLYESTAVFLFFICCFLDILFASFNLAFVFLVPSFFLFLGLLFLTSKVQSPP